MGDRIGGTLKPRPKPQTESAAALVRQPRSFSIANLADQLSLDCHDLAETARLRDVLVSEAEAFLANKRLRYQQRGARA